MNKRDDYVEKLKLQLDRWNADIAKWEAKAKGAQADALKEYNRHLDAVRHQRDHSIKQLQQVQSATGDAWKDLAHGADEAWAKMRESFEKARSHFQK